MAGDRRGVVKVQDELAVSRVALALLVDPVFAVCRKFGYLPSLALVFAKVLDDKGLHVRDGKQPLSRGVDGEAAQVASDPAAIEFFGDSGGCAAADKAVQD